MYITTIVFHPCNSMRIFLGVSAQMPSWSGLSWPLRGSSLYEALTMTVADSLLGRSSWTWLAKWISNATRLKQVKHLCLAEVSICPNGKAPVLFSLAQHSPQTTVAPSSWLSNGSEPSPMGPAQPSLSWNSTSQLSPDYLLQTQLSGADPTPQHCNPYLL